MMSLFKLNIDAGGNGYKLMSFDLPRKHRGSRSFLCFCGKKKWHK